MEFAFNRPFRADDSYPNIGRSFFVAATKDLHKLSRLAVEAGAQEVALEAEELALRLAAGRFHVACVGQFKRGKSTLINALLGQSVLPTGVAPVTSVPTIVCHGAAAARIRHDGHWRAIEPATIVDYVSQERNPENMRCVSAVEVTVPAALLAEGLCLVDTPGLGSVFHANTARAMEFLPHIDAAVVVLGADPPISGEELQFVVRLARQIDTLLFVLNKIDRVPPVERDEAATFTRRVLSEALGQEPHALFQISAITGGDGPDGQHDWGELTAALTRLARESGLRLVRGAADRGVRRLAGRLKGLILEERQAILAPVEASDRRLEKLRELASGAERATRELGPLLAAEESRLVELFAGRRREFLTQMLPQATAQLTRRNEPAAARDVMLALAADIARETLEPWLEASEVEAERAYATSMTRFADLPETLLRQTTQLNAFDEGEGASLVTATSEGRFLERPRRFYFTRLLAQHESPLPWMRWLGRLPIRALSRARLRAAEQYLEHLLRTNAERVENDLRQRVTEERQRLQKRLQQHIAETGQAAARAVERGRAVRASGADAARTALSRVDDWLVRLETL